MIMGSWTILHSVSCALPAVFKLVPILYGIASAGVLLTIAVKRLPNVDAGLIGGIVLLILAVLAPCIELFCYKLEEKNARATPAYGYQANISE